MYVYRCTQDALENLFSQIRAFGDACPTAVKFRRTLRLVTLGQLSFSSSGASYAEDDAHELLDFLKAGETGPTEVADEDTDEELPEVPEDVQDRLALHELNALAYVCGWLCHKELHRRDVCKDCTVTLFSPPADNTCILISHKEYDPSSPKLCRPSRYVLDIFQQAEAVLAQLLPNVVKKHQVLGQLGDKVQHLIQDDCTRCGILQAMMTRFVRFRTHLFAKQQTKIGKLEGHGSKSVARKTTYV